MPTVKFVTHAPWFAALLFCSAPAGAEQKPLTPSVPTRSTHSRAVTGGALLFGVAYGIALYLPIKQRFEGDATWLAVPFAGPFAAMTDKPDDVAYAGLAFDGIAQLGGAVLFAAGLAQDHASMRSISLRVWRDRRGCSVVARF
jgi:hypothetical protein